MSSSCASSSRPRKSILKTSSETSYQSPHYLIYELNNMACPLISSKQSLDLASESCRAALKIIMALLRTDLSEVNTSPAVQDACERGTVLIDQMTRLATTTVSSAERDQDKNNALHHHHDMNNHEAQSGVTNINAPLALNLLEMSSYSLGQNSSTVLYNMALCARLTPGRENDAIQLYELVYESTDAIGDQYKKLQMIRRILRSMIDIYTKNGYHDEVTGLLDQLMATEVQGLVDFPVASAAA